MNDAEVKGEAGDEQSGAAAAPAGEGDSSIESGPVVQVDPPLKVTEAIGVAEETSPSRGGISVMLPMPSEKPKGYVPTHFEVSLSGKQAAALRAIGDGFAEASGRLSQGPGDTIQILLDLVAEILEPAADA